MTGVTGQLSTLLILATLPLGMTTISSPVAQMPGLDAAGDNAAVVEFVDRLHRQPQRQLLQRPGRFERVERLDHGRALVPADPVCVFGNAIAIARGNRNHGGRRHTERNQMRGNFVADLVEFAALKSTRSILLTTMATCLMPNRCSR